MSGLRLEGIDVDDHPNLIDDDKDEEPAEDNDDNKVNEEYWRQKHINYSDKYRIWLLFATVEIRFETVRGHICQIYNDTNFGSISQFFFLLNSNMILYFLIL